MTLLETFTQNPAPLGSLTLWALVALIPLLVVFVALGVLKAKAHWAALAGLACAIIVAIAAFHMPATLALLSAAEGAAYGLFPIQWIVITTILLYQLTVVSGRLEHLRTGVAERSYSRLVVIVRGRDEHRTVLAGRIHECGIEVE